MMIGQTALLGKQVELGLLGREAGFEQPARVAPMPLATASGAPGAAPTRPGHRNVTRALPCPARSSCGR